ncbi:Amino acid transporter AVT1E [Araneus ventricosus]|uniref:Amino acid transporter AVT1E n=1 Tax=Araneus ventricosus TaxID=182803 RepID=A0A4Y2NJ86_ARAVE|nr:Amino acid transporter AVT1E [Araneus ventricosus]
MDEDKYPVLQMADIILTHAEGGDETKENEDTPKTTGHENKGLSFWIASVFIVGQMAGSGVLALPAAMRDAGWSGIPLLLFSCLNSLYAGICLGRCWSILEERYEEYKGKCRYPYPAIAYRAFGKKTQHIVSFCIDVNLFGVAIVFLLLSSQLIASVAHNSGVSFCYWVLILAVFLCPLMWLGTPDDFWPAAVIALGTTITACILLIVLIARDAASSAHTNYPSPDPTKFFLAFGTIYFSFGGAASFPTFQNDMRNRNDFAKAATMGFAFLLLLYLPVAILGYATYGDQVQDDVIDSISGSTVKSIIQVLLALHMLFAFLLVINASSQEFEEFFKIPNKFGWKRVVIRSSMMLLIVFMAQSVPKFGKVLSLVGGSAITLTASVFPCIFYYRLCSLTQPDWPERYIPLHEKIYLIVIIVYGILGGCMSTYAAVDGIVKPDSFVPPCYVNSTAANAI